MYQTVSCSGPEMACSWRDCNSMPLDIQRVVVDYYIDVVIATKCTGAEVDHFADYYEHLEFYLWNIVGCTD